VHHVLPRFTLGNYLEASGHSGFCPAGVLDGELPETRRFVIDNHVKDGLVTLQCSRMASDTDLTVFYLEFRPNARTEANILQLRHRDGILEDVAAAAGHDASASAATAAAASSSSRAAPDHPNACPWKVVKYSRACCLPACQFCSIRGVFPCTCPPAFVDRFLAAHPPPPPPRADDDASDDARQHPTESPRQKHRALALVQRAGEPRRQQRQWPHKLDTLQQVYEHFQHMMRSNSTQQMTAMAFPVNGSSAAPMTGHSLFRGDVVANHPLLVDAGRFFMFQILQHAGGIAPAVPLLADFAEDPPHTPARSGRASHAGSASPAKKKKSSAQHDPSSQATPSASGGDDIGAADGGRDTRAAPSGSNNNNSSSKNDDDNNNNNNSSDNTKSLTTCKICNHAFRFPAHLRSHHENIHLKNKSLKCHLCSYQSGRRGDLNKHIRAVHEKLHRFLCPYCEFGGAQMSNLKSHLKSKHPGRDQEAQRARHPTQG